MPPLPNTQTYRAPLKHRIYALGQKRTLSDDFSHRTLQWSQSVGATDDQTVKRTIRKIGCVKHVDEIWLPNRCGLPWRKHPNTHTIVYMADGSANLLANGKTYTLRTGDFLYLPPSLKGKHNLFTANSYSGNHLVTIDVEPISAIFRFENRVKHFSTISKNTRPCILCPLMIPTWAPPPPLFDSSPGSFNALTGEESGNSGFSYDSNDSPHPTNNNNNGGSDPNTKIIVS